MKKKNNGFTLIELMVSVGLMVLLLGIVFNIFTSTSEVVTRTEATMEMFQNARVIFDIMSQDFTNARAIKLQNAESSTDYDTIEILRLITTTSWIKDNKQTIGSATVTYSLQKAKRFESEILYYLQRQIKDEEDNPTIIGEYLVKPGILTGSSHQNVPFYIEAFKYNSSKWESKIEISDSKDVPPAVRVTMTLADEFLRNRQTFSRVFWIPQGK